MSYESFIMKLVYYKLFRTDWKKNPIIQLNLIMFNINQNYCINSKHFVDFEKNKWSC